MGGSAICISLCTAIPPPMTKCSLSHPFLLPTSFCTKEDDSSSKVHPGQVDVHEGTTEKILFTSATSRASDLNGTTQAPSPVSLRWEPHVPASE